LEGPEYSFYVPQAAEGADALVDCLLALPNFNAAAFADAMSCTNAEKSRAVPESNHGGD
jgi:hypothetical protein